MEMLPLSEILNFWYECFRKAVLLISTKKDFFQSIQSGITAVAFIIGGIWALRRFYIERPLEPALVLQISANAIRFNLAYNLLHVEVLLKNTGRAAFRLPDPTNKKNEQYKSWIHIYGINSARCLQKQALQGWIDWERSPLATKLFDGWFTDTPELLLEVGEEENYAHDILIPADINIVNIWVKLFEDKIKNKKLGRPYFWSTQRVFDLSALAEPPSSFAEIGDDD